MIEYLVAPLLNSPAVSGGLLSFNLRITVGSLSKRLWRVCQTVYVDSSPIIDGVSGRVPSECHVWMPSGRVEGF
jgi:hypothetical protein